MNDQRQSQVQPLLNSGRFNDALILYQKWIQDDPENAVLYQNAAIILGELKKYSEALEMSTKALELDPSLTMPHITMAYVYDELGNITKSRQEAKIAVEKDPEMPEALCCAGILSLKDNKLEEAFQLLEKTVRIAPSFYWAHYNLAAVYQDQKNTKKLIQEITILFRLKPNIHNLFRLIYVLDRSYRFVPLSVLILSVLLSLFVGAWIILVCASLLMIIWLLGGIFIGFMAERKSRKQFFINIFIGAVYLFLGFILFIWTKFLLPG